MSLNIYVIFVKKWDKMTVLENNHPFVIISAEFESNIDVRCNILKKHWENISLFFTANYLKFNLVPM